MNYLNKIEVTRITNVIFIAAYELWFLTSRYNVNNIKYPKYACIYFELYRLPFKFDTNIDTCDRHLATRNVSKSWCMSLIALIYSYTIGHLANAADIDFE